MLAALGAQVEAGERLVFISTVTRAPNVPMLVSLKLIEREEDIVIALKDVRASETAVVVVAAGQGELGIGFGPFFPAVEKGAKIIAVVEMSRPEAVLMAAFGTRAL